MERDARIAEEVAAGAHPEDEQFRVLVDSVTDYAIFLIDTTGRVVSWNAGAERIKGYGAAEILGRHFSVFYPIEERAAGLADSVLQRAQREGRYQHEAWRVRKDGTRFWADVTITALRGPMGELKGFAKVTRDMSARQRERENELMLAAMFERTPAGIAMADVTGRFVRANPVFLRMVGYSAEELAHKTIGDLTHPQDAEDTWRLFDDLVQGRRNQADYENRYLRKNGQVIWVRNSVARLPDADGRLRYIIGMVEDITERRRAHEALRESEARLQAFTQHSPAAMFLKDREGRYRFVNEQFLQRFDLRRDQVVGHSDDQLFNLQQARTLSARDAEVLARGVPIQFEDAAQSVGGERFNVVSKFPVFDSTGAVVGVGGVATDITEQKHAEAALRTAADNLQALTRRLVEAEEVERRRIARELHDRVGQNLSALNINLDIVLGSLKDPALKRRLEDSLKLVDGTLQSIENVMADLRPALLDEYGLGAALAWYGEEYSQRTGIHVSVDAHEAGSALRPEAAVALFRIAQEALNNAAKHSSARRIRVLLEEKDGELMLSAIDDGCGFDPAQAPRGRWGMTTMRERAQAAGGRLAVDSDLGKGTTVRATVPL